VGYADDAVSLTQDCAKAGLGGLSLQHEGLGEVWER
jgi:hypothetical protein